MKGINNTKNLKKNLRTTETRIVVYLKYFPI